jgi:hypothetical protein
VIPHRPPPGVPPELLEPADRAAFADHGGGNADWARACRDAARAAITSPDAAYLMEFGLSRAALRPGRKLAPRSGEGDSLGAEILTALAKRARGEA